MTQIVATAEQIRLMKEANGGLEFMDDQGNRLGVIVREADLEDIRIAKERLQSKEAPLSYTEVLEHLRILEAEAS